MFGEKLFSMKLSLVLSLLIVQYEFINGEDRVSKKTNIVILIDVGKQYHRRTSGILRNVLDGISLRQFRIALHATNGLSKRITAFQSKQCLLKKFEKSSKRFYSLGHTLKKATNDILHEFSKDSYIILLITDKEVSKSRQTFLFRLSNGTNVFVNYLHKDTSKTLSRRKIRYIASRDAKKIIKFLPFVKGNLLSCTRAGHDECGRSCDCIHGKLTNCYRIRQEFSSMTLRQRERYINVYKDLTTNERYKKVYEQFAHIHQVYFHSGIHKQDQFLPWHRKYLLGYENLLQLVDCRVTVPVWNWALHANKIWSITPSYHMWKSIGGFGGNGDFSKSFCVVTGKFNYLTWSTQKHVNNFIDMISTTCADNSLCEVLAIQNLEYTNCLRRRFCGRPITIDVVKYVIKSIPVKRFEDLDLLLRADWHNDIHNIVGGHMDSDYASDAPEFWSHHTMLDSIWDEWQKKGKKYKFVAFNDKHERLVGFKPKEQRYMYVDNDNLGGCGIRVRYDDIFKSQMKEEENGAFSCADQTHEDMTGFNQMNERKNVFFRRTVKDEIALRELQKRMPFLKWRKEITQYKSRQSRELN